MSIKYRCINCGWDFVSPAYGDADVSQSMEQCPKCKRPTLIDFRTRTSQAGKWNGLPPSSPTSPLPTGPIVSLDVAWIREVHQRIKSNGLSVSQASDFVKLVDTERNRAKLTREASNLAPLVKEVIGEIDRSANTQPTFWKWVFRVGAITGIATGINELPVSASLNRAYDWVQEWVLDPKLNPDEPSNFDKQVGWNKPPEEI